MVQDVLRDTEDHDLGMALSHFFNCFFGSCQVLATKAASNMQSRTPKKVCSMPDVSLWMELYLCSVCTFFELILNILLAKTQSLFDTVGLAVYA